MISENLIQMFILAFASIFLLVALMFCLEYLKKMKYEFEFKKYCDERKVNRDLSLSRYDESRDYFEKQIYDLQEKLLNNERRWSKVNHLITDDRLSLANTSEQKNLFLDLPFFSKLGIDYRKVDIDTQLVFVLTPYIRQEEQTYNIIKKVCTDVGLKCSRGDEVYRDNNILSHIVSEIIKAKLIIVNINGRNPNVFYELGICHTIGKPVILLSLNKEGIPFDIISKNIVFYKDDMELASKLKNELLKMFIKS